MHLCHIVCYTESFWSVWRVPGAADHPSSPSTEWLRRLIATSLEPHGSIVSLCSWIHGFKMPLIILRCRWLQWLRLILYTPPPCIPHLLVYPASLYTPPPCIPHLLIYPASRMAHSTSNFCTRNDKLRGTNNTLALVLLTCTLEHAMSHKQHPLVIAQPSSVQRQGTIDDAGCHT